MSRLDRKMKAAVRALGAVEQALATTEFATLAEATEAWDDLDQMRGRCADLAAVVKATVATRFGRKPEFLTLKNGTVVSFQYGKNRKTWDHSRLASVVAERILDKRVDPDTGEVAPPSVLITSLLQFAHVDYWKVKALRDELGIDADTYCEATPGNFSIRPTRPA